MLSHRSAEFRKCIYNITPRLCQVVGTATAPMLFTCSGTGGLEAAIANALSPGMRALAIRMGSFGDRFAEIARHLGADVINWNVPWGQAADPADVRQHLQAAHPLEAILLTHNETSTGVLNPLADLVPLIREATDGFILVDCTSSMGATAIDMDALGIDCVISATQKALMSPPGMTVIAASDRLMHVAEQRNTSSYYFDFARMQEAIAEGTTTYTPCVSTLLGLDAALGLIHAEGLDAVFHRHQSAAEHFRERLSDSGLTLFADPAVASPTVTSLCLPDGFSATEVRSRLESDHRIYVAQGRQEWKEKMLRVGHMGWFQPQELEAAAAALGSIISPPT